MTLRKKGDIRDYRCSRSIRGWSSKWWRCTGTYRRFTSRHIGGEQDRSYKWPSTTNNRFN